MCLAVVFQIVRWLHGMLPRSMYLMMWWLEMLPCSIGLGEVDHWMTATWHYGGAHLSGDLCLGGAHLLMWTNRRVPRGTWLLRWLNQRLPCVSVWWSSCWCGPVGECHVACVGSTCQISMLTWTNRIMTRGSACWPDPLWCCHVAHFLSSPVLYPLCFLHPVCT
jgi:hypothetical protein